MTILLEVSATQTKQSSVSGNMPCAGWTDRSRTSASASWVSVSLSLLVWVVRPTSANSHIAEDASNSLLFFENTRIIGGTIAEENRYPYSVALLSNGRFGCGGSLISKDTVLTAAHCLRDSITVAIGSDRVDQGERIRAIKAVEHPSYNDNTDEYDIGLLFLENSTTLDIPLPFLNYDNSFPAPGSTGFTIGWGDTDPGSNQDFPEELMVVDLQVISNEKCEQAENGGKSYRDWIFEEMLCTYSDGKDACQGDSGGPLIVRNNLPQSDIIVGVTSWGVGCALLPGVFSRVSMSYNWIQDTLCEESNDPPETFCGELMSPTKRPTISPTTTSPTSSPTGTASSVPSESSIPTSLPSASPTLTPSPTLSNQPSSRPTSSPVKSVNPSNAPSALPRVSSTVKLSVVQSMNPSGSPTLMASPYTLPRKQKKDFGRNSQLFSDTNELIEEGETSNSSYRMGPLKSVLSSIIIMTWAII